MMSSSKSHAPAPLPEKMGESGTHDVAQAAAPAEEKPRMPPRPSSKEYASGNVVAGKYSLIRPLGEGGMGTVWVAKNLALDVPVALKLMHRQLGSAHGERLAQEARAAASIGHPAIIQVYDFGKTSWGDPLIAMELLHGESLGEALRRRGRVSATRAVQTILPIIDALAAAHARGIVHRDLKPDNIFLSRPTGTRLQPKVLDFGIAKLDAEEKGDHRLTKAGTVLGSPSYMSPEQALGETDVDARADIWAISIVLYEMVAGNPPFEADNYNALMRAIIDLEPPPLDRSGIDQPDLWQLLRRGLAKERHGRWPNMTALGQALAAWLIEQGVQEDITNASLASTWMQRAAGGAAPTMLSFFPSMSPGPIAEDIGKFHQAVASVDIVNHSVATAATTANPVVPSIKRPSDVPTKKLTAIPEADVGTPPAGIELAPESAAQKAQKKIAGVLGAIALALVALAGIIHWARAPRASAPPADPQPAIAQPHRDPVPAATYREEPPPADTSVAERADNPAPPAKAAPKKRAPSRPKGKGDLKNPFR